MPGHTRSRLGTLVGGITMVVLSCDGDSPPLDDSGDAGAGGRPGWSEAGSSGHRPSHAGASGAGRGHGSPGGGSSIPSDGGSTTNPPESDAGASGSSAAGGSDASGAGTHATGGTADTGGGGADTGGRGEGEGGQIAAAGGESDFGWGGAPFEVPPCGQTVEVTCLSDDTSGIGGASAIEDMNNSELAVAEFRNVQSLASINRFNQVAGALVCVEPPHSRAFVLEDGGARELLEGVEYERSHAVDINDYGVIVGWVSKRGPDGMESAHFVWNDGTVTLIRDLRVGAALSINNREQVLFTSGKTSRAGGYVWENGELTRLPEFAVAKAMNDLGQVTGTLTYPETDSVAFLWEAGVLTAVPALRTGEAIDNYGRIIGVSSISESSSPLTWGMWDGEALVELPLEPASRGRSLIANSDGTGIAMGNQYIDSDGARRRLWALFDYEREIVEEVDLFGYPSSINQDGVIVGEMEFRIWVCRNKREDACLDGGARSVVWSPGCFGSCCSGAETEE